MLKILNCYAGLSVMVRTSVSKCIGLASSPNAECDASRGKSLFCHTFQSFTVLVELCNEMATYLNFTGCSLRRSYVSSVDLRAWCPF